MIRSGNFGFLFSSFFCLIVSSASEKAAAQAIRFHDATDAAGITPNDPSGYGHGSSFGDFNGDGRPDIYMLSYGTANFLFRNIGGHFTDIAGSAGVQNPTTNDRGMAAADYDNDGDLDIFFTNTGQNSVLLQNDGPFHNWLQIKLRGNASNRDGVGAKLTGWLNGQRQTQAIIAGQAYLCTGSDLTAHFALGSSNKLDSLIMQNNVTYHYRVKSKDAAGNLATSNDFTFTTGNTSIIFSDDFNTAALDGNKWRKGTNAGNQAAVSKNALQLRSRFICACVLTTPIFISKPRSTARPGRTLTMKRLVCRGPN